jgi:hypothetical protein
MIPGVEITDGARTFTIAPMNLRILLESNKDDVDRISRGSDGDKDSFNAAAINLLLACGKRNHPDMTRDNILDAVDVADLSGLIVQVMTKSGMKPSPLAATPASLPPEPVSSGSSSAQPAGSPTTS